MRTKTLLLTAALGAAGIASSMAQVYSVNAVGYVNTTLLPGFNLISNPLNNTTGNTATNLFTTGFQGGPPDGLTVYAFNTTTDAFQSVGYDALGAEWGPVSGHGITLPPGTGAFVFNPATTNSTVTFVGEVPQGAASNQQLVQGFQIKASTVPAGGPITGMNFPAQDGDTIYQWDPVNDRYFSNTFDALEGPNGAWTQNVPNIGVGEAFFLFKNLPQGQTSVAWDRNFNVNQ